MNPERARALKGYARARARYAEALPILWQPPNVVGVGIGPRVFQGQSLDEACFIVYVREKKPGYELPRLERCPREVCGVPVDVQVATWGTLGRMTAAEPPHEGRIWAMGRKPGEDKGGEAGTLGMLARMGGAPYAITAMHVLAPDFIPTKTKIRDDLVVCAMLSGREVDIGVVEDGRLTGFRDIALIRLTHDPVVLAALERLVVDAGEPAWVQEGKPMYATIHAEPTHPSGWLKATDVSGIFETDRGEQFFNGLLEFDMSSDVQLGWSGGLVYTSGRAPVALLSFRGEKDRRRAFGWPIAEFYRYWGLSPWNT